MLARKISLLFPLAVAGALAVAGPAVAGPGHCPPGLAKKGCVPPGHAKKHNGDTVYVQTVPSQPVYVQTVPTQPVYVQTVTPRRVYVVGQPLPADVTYVRIDDWRHYGLSAPRSGTHYARVDGDVLLMQNATRQVVEAIGAVSALLN